MSVPRVVVAALLAFGLSACSSSSASTSGAAASTSAAAAAATTATAGATTDKTQPASAAGGDGDFCAAFTEYRGAMTKPDMQSRGDGLRKSAAAMKAHAPGEIKASVDKFADILDSLGKAFSEGKANDGLKAAQSPDFTKALTDVAIYTSKNCKN